jgi:endonuclease YncB( thermonuclease family)
MLERAAGIKARDRARAYVAACRGTVVVQTIKLPGENIRDKYGRTLARVWLPINGTMVDLAERLLAEGHARAYDGGTKTTQWEHLRPLNQLDADPA